MRHLSPSNNTLSTLCVSSHGSSQISIVNRTITRVSNHSRKNMLSFLNESPFVATGGKYSALPTDSFLSFHEVMYLLTDGHRSEVGVYRLCIEYDKAHVAFLSFNPPINPSGKLDERVTVGFPNQIHKCHMFLLIQVLLLWSTYTCDIPLESQGNTQILSVLGVMKSFLHY